MSEQPPVDYPALIEPPQQPKWPGYVAWVVIWSVAIFLVFGNFRSEHKSSTADAAPDSGSSVADLQLKVAGKTLMGLKALESSTTTAPSTNSDQAERSMLFGEIDTIAKSPAHKLRVAILIAELQNADNAIKRLDSISQTPDLSPAVREDVQSVQKIYASGPSSLDAQQREHLLQNEGYFGETALSFGLPPSDPLRQKVLSEGRTIVLLSSLLFIVGIIGGIVSLGLFITAIVLTSTGKIRPLYQPQPYLGTVYVEMFALWLVSYLALSVLASWIGGERLSLHLVWIVTLSLPIAFAWGMMRGLRWNDLRHALGWHAGRGLHIEIPLGFVGYLAGVPIIATGVGITLILVWLSGATPSHPIVGASSDSPLNVLLLYGIASVMAPVIEETMFRGALFHHMRRRWSWLISAGVVALLFAAVHPQGWTLIPALASIAIVLATLREWRGSILAPMIAHGFHNGMLITMLVIVSS